MFSVRSLDSSATAPHIGVMQTPWPQSYLPRGTLLPSALLAAVTYGALYGLFPIGWIVLNALFVFAITVHTGIFDVVRDSVVSIADRSGLQAASGCRSLFDRQYGAGGVRRARDAGTCQ